MKSIGLVLEGGGLRGQFTAGVLDLFLTENIEFPYIIGSSAGVSIGSSYVSKQHSRNKHIVLTYIKDHRYLSFRNLIFKGGIFGIDFIFNKIPNELVPFDFKTFDESPVQFITTVTDCNTGKPVYFPKNTKNLLQMLAASSSIPLLSKIVKYNGLELLDGAVADSVPVKKSIEDGYEKNVIILTRNKGYRKKANSYPGIIKLVYKKYPEFIKAMLERYKNYNKTMDFIDDLEKEGKAIVIRPSQTLKIDKLEKDVKKLEDLYNLGVEDAKKFVSKIKDWQK
jgi:predicted patatin/cPLA2 family phospholipase